jgi:uncharacterized protein (DUF2141 family)
MQIFRQLSKQVVGLVVSLFTVVSPIQDVNAESGPKDAGRIILAIQNVQHHKGVIRCGLYERENWLDAEDAVEWVDAEYKSGSTAECVFSGIEAGTYGVGVFHDADADHDMDSNFLGIPSEAVCASKDPEASMGPPDFDGAKFEHSAEETTAIACTMRY